MSPYRAKGHPPRRADVRPPPLVLVVQGDTDARQMYAAMLAYSGMRVIESAMADDAFRKAHVLRPDIVATGIGLPGGNDGCQLCERLKSDRRTQAIPVIVVTAWVSGGHLERARQAGCDSVLIKPCSPDVLLEEIQRLLRLASDR